MNFELVSNHCVYIPDTFYYHLKIGVRKEVEI